MTHAYSFPDQNDHTGQYLPTKENQKKHHQKINISVVMNLYITYSYDSFFFIIISLMFYTHFLFFLIL